MASILDKADPEVLTKNITVIANLLFSGDKAKAKALVSAIQTIDYSMDESEEKETPEEEVEEEGESENEAPTDQFGMSVAPSPAYKM